MSRAELKAAAKEQIKGKIGTLFVMLLILFLIGVAGALIPIVGPIALVILTPAFSLSFCMIYLKLTKNEEIKVGDITLGLSYTGKALWLNILVTFFTFLWSLLFIIPGFIKQFSYSMSNFILADNPELTAREALAKSKEMMNGHKVDLFILYLSFIGWYLLGAITFGIAYIYIVPYFNATIANFYNSIKA